MRFPLLLRQSSALRRDQRARRFELAAARESLVNTMSRAGRVKRRSGMLDAPTLRQAARLQRVDETPPPGDLHVM